MIIAEKKLHRQCDKQPHLQPTEGAAAFRVRLVQIVLQSDRQLCLMSNNHWINLILKISFII